MGQKIRFRLIRISTNFTNKIKYLKKGVDRPLFLCHIIIEVNKERKNMTPSVFKHNKMRANLFAKYKKEPFESFETIEDTYEMPEVLDFEIKNAITQVLSTLTPREERVIRERFFNNKTLEEVGQTFSVTRNRIRQIEAKALRKMKHPSRSEILKKVA